MKIFLLMKHAPERRRCKLPFEGADHAIADGCCPYCSAREDCPGCSANGNSGTTPDWKQCKKCLGKGGGFKIAGSGRRPSDDDRAWEADAGCLACKAHVGTLRVESNTLFGVREDERVLRGRVRVY